MYTTNLAPLFRTLFQFQLRKKKATNGEILIQFLIYFVFSIIPVFIK